MNYTKLIQSIKNNDEASIELLMRKYSKLLWKLADDILCQIGTVGNTGMSTGPHLHLEMTQNGELIDPTSFIYPNYKDYFELDN